MPLCEPGDRIGVTRTRNAASPTPPQRSHDSQLFPAIVILTDPRGDPGSQGLVPLGVDLGHVGAGMAEQYLGRFEPVLFPHLGRIAVPKLVRVPAMCLPPGLYLFPLLHREAIPPFLL